MKISAGVFNGNGLTAHRRRPLTREKPTASDTQATPDGLGGNG